jgi:ABC-type antimicrobial peptide transport system permease subunit
VRAGGRRRERAIRQSLGASRWRLVRQALTESLLLALSGGAAGALLAQWALPLLLRLSPHAIPRWNGTTVDRGALAFTLIISFVAGLLFGFVQLLAPCYIPARWATKVDPLVALRYE